MASSSGADADPSTCVRAFWIGAEHALIHARSQIPAISKVFRRRNIQETEYIVRVGFDEKLIMSRIGCLEQIHVFVSAKLGKAAITHLLPELGRILSPFSSVLFTESSSYLVPIFKDNGDIYEFNQLVYHTASRFPDKRSTTSIPLTVIGLSHARSSDSPSSSSQPRCSNQNNDKGRQRDRGDDDGSSDEDLSKDGPDDPSSPTDPSGPGSEPQGADGIRTISFDTMSEVCKVDADVGSIFQRIGVKGAISIQTIHSDSQSETSEYPERHLKFRELVFDTEQPSPEVGYRQTYIGIIVDPRVEMGIAGAGSLYPKRTKARRPDQKSTSATTNGTNNGTNGAPEKKDTRTTQYDIDGAVEWGFHVDDIHDQARGTHMDADILPRAKFVYVSEEKVLSKRMDVAISSYWSYHPKPAPEAQGASSTWSDWFCRKFTRTPPPTTGLRISYSNLLQVVALKTFPDSLPIENQYNANVRFRFDDVGPPAPYVKTELPKPQVPSSAIDSSPAVFDDPHKLLDWQVPGFSRLQLSSQVLEERGNQNPADPK